MSQQSLERFGFTSGWSYLWLGINNMFKPGLRAYVYIPLLISAIFFSGLVWVCWHELGLLGAWVKGFMPWWLDWLEWLLLPLLQLAVVLVLLYGFSMLANLVAAPFNGLLAEKVWLELNGGLQNYTKSKWQLAGATLFRQLQFMGYYIIRAIGCLLLFLVPFVHVFAGVIWLLFSAWMMCLQYADYSMELQQISLRQMRAHLGAQRAMSLGFGAAVLCCSLVPVLNILVIPAAVIGATHMVHDLVIKPA